MPLLRFFCSYTILITPVASIARSAGGIFTNAILLFLISAYRLRYYTVGLSFFDMSATCRCSLNKE